MGRAAPLRAGCGRPLAVGARVLVTSPVPVEEGASGIVSSYGPLPGQDGLWVGVSFQEDCVGPDGVAFRRPCGASLLPEEAVAAAPVPRGHAGDTPRRLYLIADERPDCMGEYRLVEGVTVSDQPVWKKAGPDRWIYSAPSSSSSGSGTWMVGGPTEEVKGFRCKTGYLHLRRRHNGAPPDRVAALGGAAWSLWRGSSWAKNADVELVDATGGFTAVKDLLDARIGGIEASRDAARAEHAALQDELRELERQRLQAVARQEALQEQKRGRAERLSAAGRRREEEELEVEELRLAAEDLRRENAEKASELQELEGQLARLREDMPPEPKASVPPTIGFESW